MATAQASIHRRRRPPVVKLSCMTWRRAILIIVWVMSANIVLLLTQFGLPDPKAGPGSSPLHYPGIFGKTKLRKSSIIKRPNHQEHNIDLPSDTPPSSLTPREYTRQLRALEEQLQASSCHKAGDGTYAFNGNFCKDSSTFIYYNGLSRERFLCDGTTVIPPHSSVTSKTQCPYGARLFPVTPNRTGVGMPPVQLEFTNAPQTAPIQPFPCDVPCLNKGNPAIVAERIVKTIDGSDQHWRLAFSMEGPDYYRQLKIDPVAYKQNRFYSTTSYQSEVPLPYFSWAEYKIHVPAIPYDSAIKGAAFLARNCKSRNNREQIVKDLQASTFRVDSLSSCLHNAEPPANVALAGNKNNIMKHYLLYLAFENQCTNDYITEKLWGPLETGVLPVYYGSPNVKEYVPENSIIHVDDFPTTQDLAEYLEKVVQNRTLYEWHQAWRSKPLPEHFHSKFDFTEVHSTCRTCRWAYARFYGLGWNHSNQTLRELVTPREPCVNRKKGVLEKPFREYWLELEDNGIRRKNAKIHPLSDSTCPLRDVSILDIGDGACRRTVREQDGAIDMYLEPLTASTNAMPSLLLRLEIPFHDDELRVKVIKEGQLRMQDRRTRFTFLTWPPSTVLNVKMNEEGGVVEVPFVEMNSLRLRILVEDIDMVHEGADEEENFFGKLMADDFFNPVQVFVQ